MVIPNFLATAAGNFRSHFLELAAQNKTEIKTHSRLIDPGSTSNSRPVKADSFVPSGLGRKNDTESPGRSEHGKKSEHAKHDRFDPSSNIASRGIKSGADHENDHDNDNKSNPLEKAPDGTYSYRRTSTLEFKLDLKFELGAITRTAKRLENGDITAIDSFAAAGFGLRAVMQAEGRQEVETSQSGDSDSAGSELRLKQFSSSSARSAREFAFQDKNLALKALSEESASVSRTLDVKVRENQRRAVNSISMRFRSDSSFTFAHATRFNVQTNRVAEKAPEAVGQYLDTAGKLASSAGSSDLVNGFFDAVDSYLSDSEAALLDKVTAFFDTATKELGFSSGLVDVAREKLTESITGFFDKVELSLDAVASQFSSASSVTSQQIQPPTQQPVPLANRPAPVDFASPELDKDRALLAVA